MPATQVARLRVYHLCLEFGNNAFKYYNKVNETSDLTLALAVRQCVPLRVTVVPLKPRNFRKYGRPEIP